MFQYSGNSLFLNFLQNSSIILALVSLNWSFIIPEEFNGQCFPCSQHILKSLFKTQILFSSNFCLICLFIFLSCEARFFIFSISLFATSFSFPSHSSAVIFDNFLTKFVGIKMDPLLLPIRQTDFLTVREPDAVWNRRPAPDRISRVRKCHSVV